MQTFSKGCFQNSHAKHQSPLKINWCDWKWQLKNSIKDIVSCEKFLNITFPLHERAKISETLDKFPLSITPYYLSLVEKDCFRTDPVFLQAFPSINELDTSIHERFDPLAEEDDSPASGITHRYPDRVLFHVSNVCAMYCRHCTRKRKVGDTACVPSKDMILEGLSYIRSESKVRDVLLSGGDPLMLSDDYLEWILAELRRIKHVQVIRIGTRMPAVLPYRITQSLVSMIKKYHPVWVNTHFNHPKEITSCAKEALGLLADAGIPLGNQSVLLAGVNDCPEIIKSLVHLLVENRVRPYYLYQCDLSEGLSHFRTPIGKGIEIMESLIGHTSGLAVPKYVVDAPGGGGKIPLTPNYLISCSARKVVLRNYEGVLTTYQEPENYTDKSCDMGCDECILHRKKMDNDNTVINDVKTLLTSQSGYISLTPENNSRMKRRKKKYH